jgi:hypothetical protein
MSKLLEKNKDIIHVAIEVVVLTIIAYVFNSKIQKLSSEVTLLNLRIAEQDKKFKEYDRIIYSLTNDKYTAKTYTEFKPEPIFKQNSPKNNVKETVKPTKQVKPVKEIFIEREPVDIPISIPKTQSVKQNKVNTQEKQRANVQLQEIAERDNVQRDNVQEIKQINNPCLYNDSSETTSDLDAELEKELQELEKDKLVSSEPVRRNILKIENEQIQKNIQETLQTKNNSCESASRIQSPVLIPTFETLHDNFKLNKEKTCNADVCSSNDDGVCSREDGVCLNDDGVCLNDDGVCLNDDGVCLNDDGVCSSEDGVCSSSVCSSEVCERSNENNTSERSSSDKDIQEISTADMEEYNPNGTFLEMIFQKSN